MIKILVVVGIIALFLGGTITPMVNADVLTIKQNTNNQKTITISDAIEYPINVPTWNVGNSWTYNMDWGFRELDDNGGTTLSVDGNIPRMCARVEGITTINNEDAYVLSLDGYLTGKVKLLNFFDIGNLNNVQFSGTAYINVNKLAPQKFYFEVNGDVGLPLGSASFYFTMEMNFNPSFDFINFPIYQDEANWELDVDASLSAHVKIVLLGVINYENDYNPPNMDFDDTISMKGVKSIEVGAGTFEAVELGGIYGDPSELYYAPDVGFLAKVLEDLLWGENIIATFNLDLIETNYIVGNNPPLSPDEPSGPNEGLVNTMYSYKTRTTDPEGDDVYYWFDWGDGSNSGWAGPYHSGVDVSLSHAWIQKGIYNIIVKAKDESSIESQWSDPFSVVIGYEQPSITLVMHRIEKIDEIDVWNPFDPTSSPPEWYYKVDAISKDFVATDANHHTKDGEYSTNNGDWISADVWEPDAHHELLVESRNVVVTIKLMDHDDPFWEGGDDLADVSGCFGGGADNDVSFKRGAIYHGTYDMGTNKLKPYSEYPGDNADYWAVNNGYYVVSGEDPPDSSSNTDENDARVWFTLYDDYDLPLATAQIINLPENLRPGDELQFIGMASEGASPFTWSWKFGDGTTSDIQNPIHSYSKPGKYTVTLTLKDRLNQTSIDSFEVTVYENQPPSDLTIQGSSSGKTRTTYSYTFRGLDPEGDQLSYKIDWGDGTTTGWMNQITSGEEKTQEHEWSSKGSYTITFTVKDEYGAETKATKTVSISTKSKTNVNLKFNQFLERALLSFPLFKKYQKQLINH
jgi:hypothetical protein